MGIYREHRSRESRAAVPQSHTSSSDISSKHGELGQLPIHMWWKERILKFWDRICSEGVPKLLNAAMYHSLEITQAGGKCWAQNVANIFNNAGYPEFFSGSSGCDKTMRNVIMCLYRDQFIQLWHATLEREHSPSGHGGNKLRSYRLFKNEFHLEPYLFNIQCIALRVAMIRLRVRCHSLEIEWEDITSQDLSQ